MEEELHARKALWQNLPQMPYVAGSGMMTLGVERDQDFDIAGADGSVGTVRLVDAGVGQSDVVENRLQFTFGNLLTQYGFDFVAKPRCILPPQSGAGAHRQPQQARVFFRAQVLSQKHK